jgi:hypothetical protein
MEGMSVLAQVLESIIKSKDYEVEDIQFKLDIFWSKQRLTEEEYFYLCNLMEEYPPTVTE